MKNALVTGGSGGIGKAVCLQLARSSFHVLIHYNSNKKSADEVLSLIESEGGKGETIRFDVSSKKAIESALGKWKNDNNDNHISVLVNNAGISKDNLMIWMEEGEWNSVINTNLNGFFHVTKSLLKDMIINKWGRIINIVSLSGLKGLPGQTNYSAAKAGIIGASKALAQEVGKKKITVNAIAPGYIKTEMIKNLDEKQLKTLIPVNRFGNTEEVAHLVDFLAGDNSSYITGEVININGGLYT
ncbi:MAG: 3-oxoacyl-ACP reductase FabG [Bacteroidales bacterium]|jgi:3-oxoacyl-[acyl-carrier protein] reductase|nr:3-oxoacyl-ACP reductase FabG [Lentimicrobiaceae bacterium]MDG1136584.1 3-oxoacyl-ACP reductase FabG [Bacteroidales bacterium]MDG1901600.1 3-oxoacyl-ACP reductase FabG [Bacteroidales bacterium]MDG2081649.1 3-oxoacyl-ACP reductase FabG [Bacteroidales bacterium]|tara:strand:+ start:3352 stop:4080 length:729 start_codon:yes stop_codon:yes gene_type:complete